MTFREYGILLVPPSTSDSGAASSPRSTAHALPPSTSCRPISPGRLPRLTLIWWRGQCLTWGKGQWIAAGEGRFEKKSSNQLYPCLVTDRSLMRSWRNVVQNGYLCRSYAANYNYIETHCPIITQLDLSKQKSYWISHQPEKYFPQLILTKLSFFWDTLYQFQVDLVW